MRLPAADSPLRLDPDDHLVEPGTRYEVFHGERVHVSPARPGHGALDAVQRVRIEACDDLETFERWLLCATDIHDTADLLV
jgi:hypothetical protein